MGQIEDQVKVKEMMKELSSGCANALGKPESYVCVYVETGKNVMFGGDADAPCAVCDVGSIGCIDKKTNGKVSQTIASILRNYAGVENNRFYIHFTDWPAANVGWSGRTFAG
eukprot:NODE_3779_length_406_cov_81.599440_g3342_i0.p2 GENE.NODE_3779_length_406_cov_81.599440_g3342_i0~~NODE_3779_length_406_cov_81.599440_g3342_i0.p2  ORF type:complete len:120 (-),score=38.42 NODE_3779_length_406_cov_81.599440_g3342_i0:47-382(-)